MAIRMHFLLVISLMYVGQAVTVTEGSTLMSHTSLKAMKQTFFRSEHVHKSSMADITMSITSSATAVEMLEKSNLTTPALIEITRSLHGVQSHLRRATQPKGYSGVDGARKLLNDMIYESMSKYDSEIARCTDYYSAQCSAMEAARGDISASNYLAANSRSLILDAQSEINKCEVDIPNKKLQLKNHNLKCKHELARLRERVKIVEGDIAVLTTILKMTDCKKKFVQTEKLTLLQCQDPCTQNKFVTFNEKNLQEQVSQLQSSVSHGLVQDSFKDLFQGIEALQEVDFLQLKQDYNTSAAPTPTKFNNPPVPRTKIPRNPCTDRKGGAPSARHKRAAKCTITQSPQCYKLQERFLLIQSGIQDDRDSLLQDIANMENHEKEIRQTIESEILQDQAVLSQSQTKLSFATEKEANAGETARQTAKQNEQLNADLVSTMKTCSGNYIKHETELCALKKIRGELYKMSGKEAFFVDCQVEAWDPEECSKKCGGGEQKLSRGVMTHPNGGAKCLPLNALKKCETQPCPVNCKLEPWAGWSKCSAECGGGVTQRLREVKVAMRHSGKPCGATSQTKSCNAQACEQDCELSRWTKWSHCSKQCDGGTLKRQKYVMKAASGQGKCAKKWSKTRLQYKKCNMNRCVVAKDKAMTCDKELDIVFLLDGSGSLGQTGWNAEIKAAQMFVDAFSGTGAKANMAVILYSGPRTWGGVYKCWARNGRNVDIQKTCKIKTVTHFTKDMKAVKSKISGLSWPKGSTLTSLALMSAASELSLGRKSAKSVVVVITDGRPLSYWKTRRASYYVRRKARLVWVPVTRYAPLRSIKRWATRRWQENVVRVRNFADLEKPDAVTHVVANICPKD